jgi:hypothetical protein
LQRGRRAGTVSKMRTAAILALLVSGCAHNQLRDQTRQALSECLRRHPEGRECESLARQNDMLEAQHRARVKAAWTDDQPPPAPPRRLTCRPNGLGSIDCE